MAKIEMRFALDGEVAPELYAELVKLRPKTRRERIKQLAVAGLVSLRALPPAGPVPAPEDPGRAAVPPVPAAADAGEVVSDEVQRRRERAKARGARGWGKD